jgi:hypothetical protein
MEQARSVELPVSVARRWWRRIVKKPAGEIALDLMLFVLSVVALYVIDLTVLQHFAPLAIQYMIDFMMYMNHHAVATVQMFS